MSGTMPYWSEEVCSDHFCVQDCDNCPWADEAMEYIMEMEDDEDDQF